MKRQMGVFNKTTGECQFYDYGTDDPAAILEQHCHPWKVVSLARYYDLRANDPTFEQRVRTKDNEIISSGDPDFPQQLEVALRPGTDRMVEVRIGAWNEKTHARADWQAFDPEPQFGLGQPQPLDEVLGKKRKLGVRPPCEPGRCWAMDLSKKRLVQRAHLRAIEELKIEEDRAQAEASEAIRVVGPGSEAAVKRNLRRQRIAGMIADLEATHEKDTHPSAAELF